MYFQDGYRLIQAGQLLAGVEALNSKIITFRAFRAYFGCLELLAIREAAERTTGKQKGRRFSRLELAELLGEERSPSKELGKLHRAGLLTFGESSISVHEPQTLNPDVINLIAGRGGKRLVPVPRQILKFLASCTKPALAKTVIAYLLRGLSLAKGGELKTAGTVKVSWICKLCKISERAARAARAELIKIGWITKDQGSFQRKLNRDGAYFVINAAWRRVLKQIAPPAPEKRTSFAPPIERKETLNRSKDQNLVTRPRTGICKANKEDNLPPPSLKNIQFEDLRRLSRLREIYHQALKANWLADSEASLRNFVAAAARATRVKGDPVRVFVGIVKKGLWHHLTNEDENRAHRAISREQSSSLTEGPGAKEGNQSLEKLKELIKLIDQRSQS